MKTTPSCAVVEVSSGRYEVTDPREVDYNSAVPGRFSSKSYFLVSASRVKSTDDFHQAIRGEVGGLEKELGRVPTLEEIRDQLNSKVPHYQTTPIDYELKPMIKMPKTDCFGMPYNPADD